MYRIARQINQRISRYLFYLVHMALPFYVILRIFFELGNGFCAQKKKQANLKIRSACLFIYVITLRMKAICTAFGQQP